MSARGVVLAGASPLPTGVVDPLKRVAGVYTSTNAVLALVSFESSAVRVVVVAGVPASAPPAPLEPPAPPVLPLLAALAAA